MKIEIKLTSDQIFYLEIKLQEISLITPSQFVNLDRKQKNENSLLINCYDIVANKAKSISRKPTIFDHNKKYSLSLKYHEASILNMLCCRLKDIEPLGSNFRNLAQTIFLKIDEKL